MEKHPLYGKKKKKKEICPNPLFVQWLTEWRDDAVEKNMKSQYTYGKALNTLKKFPLKLQTGKECKILENFGDKICKMLDDKLAKHISVYGTTAPVDTTDTVTDVRVNGHTTVKVTASAAAKPKQKAAVSDVQPRQIRIHELSDSSDGNEDIQQQPARKRQRSGHKSGDGDYIPVYRSGPYAILLTLYRDMQSPDSRGYMNKADLVRKAQTLADKSFTMADPGCRYTAWSSMGTLIKKNLVLKESSPARYSLTPAGCELAHRLESVKDDQVLKDDPGIPFRINDPATDPRVPTIPSLPSMQEEGQEGLDQSRPQGSYRLNYWYISEEGWEVLVKDKAAVSIDDEIGVGFLVKCNYRSLLKSGVKYKLDTSRPVGDDFVYAFLSNENTEDIAEPPFPSTTGTEPGTFSMVPDTGSNHRMLETKNKADKSGKTVSKKTKDTPQLLPLIKSSMDIKPTHIEHSKNSGDNCVVIASDDSSRESLPCIATNNPQHLTCDNNFNSKVPNYSSTSVASDGQSLFERLKVKQQSVPTSLLPDSQDSVNTVGEMSSSQGSIKSITSVSSGSSTHTLPPADFILRPGDFDIVLCIDNAEFYGASKGSSKTLLPDLIKNGIDCDLRKLHVGDILWIAKEKSKPVPGQLSRPPGRELVLNYIIERKRMDDLVGSCIDGRFKEQKFRLKKCGLHHTMYLIEEYGSMQHFSLPEATIKQAITNTQVIDGFQVKRTKDSKETVAFLTVFTRYLQSHFKDKTLYACGLEEIKESKIVTNINDSHQRLPVFEEFNQRSVKSKALTVQELFGKQLIQLHGMSAEKARAVIEKYPTPSHLFRAYETCGSLKEKENLLVSVKCGKSSRSLGQAQSRQIYQLYNTDKPLV